MGMRLLPIAAPTSRAPSQSVAPMLRARIAIGDGAAELDAAQRLVDAAAQIVDAAEIDRHGREVDLPAVEDSSGYRPITACTAGGGSAGPLLPPFFMSRRSVVAASFREASRR